MAALVGVALTQDQNVVFVVETVHGCLPFVMVAGGRRRDTAGRRERSRDHAQDARTLGTGDRRVSVSFGVAEPAHRRQPEAQPAGGTRSGVPRPSRMALFVMSIIGLPPLVSE